MRLPFIAPADLRAEQKRICEDMCTGIGNNFQGKSWLLTMVTDLTKRCGRRSR
jgi:hypothetical protein